MQSECIKSEGCWKELWKPAHHSCHFLCWEFSGSILKTKGQRKCHLWCSTFPLTDSQYMPGMGFTVPLLVYPHGASSCPLVSAFVWCRSLAVNVTASQVTEYGRFYTPYESKHRIEISNTSEGNVSTAGILAVLMPFLLDSREAKREGIWRYTYTYSWFTLLYSRS